MTLDETPHDKIKSSFQNGEFRILNTNLDILNSLSADVAELADAQASGACGLTPV